LAECSSGFAPPVGRQIARLDDRLSDGSWLRVSVLGLAAQQSEGLLSGDLMPAHQDSLGESDAMPGGHRPVQVVAFGDGF